MLQRMIDDLINEAKRKDQEGHLLIIETEAFEQIKHSDFKGKIISIKEWDFSAFKFEEDYPADKRIVIIDKGIFAKSGVDHGGFFIWNNKLWQHCPHLKCAAIDKNGNCCSFQEGLNNDDWIKPSDITPISQEKVFDLIFHNKNELVK